MLSQSQICSRQVAEPTAKQKSHCGCHCLPFRERERQSVKLVGTYANYSGDSLSQPPFGFGMTGRFDGRKSFRWIRPVNSVRAVYGRKCLACHQGKGGDRPPFCCSLCTVPLHEGTPVTAFVVSWVFQNPCLQRKSVSPLCKTGFTLRRRKSSSIHPSKAGEERGYALSLACLQPNENNDGGSSQKEEGYRPLAFNTSEFVVCPMSFRQRKPQYRCRGLQPVELPAELKHLTPAEETKAKALSPVTASESESWLSNEDRPHLLIAALPSLSATKREKGNGSKEERCPHRPKNKLDEGC